MERAAVAHLVERHLAKVEVASSSLVGRSIKGRCKRKTFAAAFLLRFFIDRKVLPNYTLYSVTICRGSRNPAVFLRQNKPGGLPQKEERACDLWQTY